MTLLKHNSQQTENIAYLSASGCIDSFSVFLFLFSFFSFSLFFFFFSFFLLKDTSKAFALYSPTCHSHLFVYFEFSISQFHSQSKIIFFFFLPATKEFQIANWMRFFLRWIGSVCTACCNILKLVHELVVTSTLVALWTLFPIDRSFQFFSFFFFFSSFLIFLHNGCFIFYCYFFKFLSSDNLLKVVVVIVVVNKIIMECLACLAPTPCIPFILYLHMQSIPFHTIIHHHTS